MARYFELEKATSDIYDDVSIHDLHAIALMQNVVTGFEVNNGHITQVEIEDIN